MIWFYLGLARLPEMNFTSRNAVQPVATNRVRFLYLYPSHPKRRIAGWRGEAPKNRTKHTSSERTDNLRHAPQSSETPLTGPLQPVSLLSSGFTKDIPLSLR